MIHMPPCYIGSGLLLAIRYRLNKFLLRYIPASQLDDSSTNVENRCVIGSVMLSYWDIRLLQDTGRIIGESAQIHFPIEFKALLFSPSIGSKLVGKVIKIGIDYIGLLVFGIFNASIAQTETDSEYCKDEEGNFWFKRSQPEKRIVLDQILEFTIIGVNKSSQQIAIVGSLKDEIGLVREASSQRMDSNNSPQKKKLKRKQMKFKPNVKHSVNNIKSSSVKQEIPESNSLELNSASDDFIEEFTVSQNELFEQPISMERTSRKKKKSMERNGTIQL